MSARILIIEDEETVARVVMNCLGLQTYSLRMEPTGRQGIQAAIEFRPDLVILDLGLPDMDGQAVLLKLREWLRSPIIVLTARDSDEDKVSALDQGADDYLTKPFSLRELQARVRVALRHHQSTANSSVYRSGALEFDLAGNTVKVDGELRHLTATELSILGVLIKHSGKVVTHRALLKEIWGPNAVEHVQYLRVYVGQLRKKLKSDQHGRELIVTEPGIGYRMTEE